MNSGPFNNVLTASRATSLLSCPRKHYWSYERGLRKDRAEIPLRVGTAWAKSLESTYRGATYDEALAIAIPEGVDLDGDACAMIAGLLGAYLRRWKDYPLLDNCELIPEHQFKLSLIPGSHGWSAEGKIDLLAKRKFKYGSEVVIVESKSTSFSIDPDSIFWTKVKKNIQLMQYVSAARADGYDVCKVIYDVTRKPAIKPKMITNKDDKGFKIVVDEKGERVFLKNGEPRQTADKKKGYVVQIHRESRDEFVDRLMEDARTRPDFYFARREIAILDDDLRSFHTLRREVIALIQHYRQRSVVAGAAAWPRNASEITCRSCQFKDFCLTSADNIEVEKLEGFTVGKFNPELEREIDDTATDEETTAD